MDAIFDSAGRVAGGGRIADAWSGQGTADAINALLGTGISGIADFIHEAGLSQNTSSSAPRYSYPKGKSFTIPEYKPAALTPIRETAAWKDSPRTVTSHLDTVADLFADPNKLAEHIQYMNDLKNGYMRPQTFDGDHRPTTTAATVAHDSNAMAQHIQYMNDLKNGYMRPPSTPVVTSPQPIQVIQSGPRTINEILADKYGGWN